MFKLNTVVILLVFLATFVASVPVQWNLQERSGIYLIKNKRSGIGGPAAAGFKLLTNGASRRIFTNQLKKHAEHANFTPRPPPVESLAQKAFKNIGNQNHQGHVPPKITNHVPNQSLHPPAVHNTHNSPILTAVSKLNNKNKRSGIGGAAVDLIENGASR